MGLDPDKYMEGYLGDVCWGPGKAFGDHPTPKKVLATFTGLGSIFKDLNGSYVLEHYEEDYCFWIAMHEHFSIGWTAAEAGLRIYDEILMYTVFHAIGDPCETAFANANEVVGGSGEIT